MIGMIVALVLTQSGPQSGPQSGQAEVAAALEKTRTSDRYSFKIETGSTGLAVEGRYQKGLPVWMKSGDLEVFRQGETLVASRKGEWRKMDVRDGDRGKVRGQASKTSLRTLRLPHEELAGLEKRFKEIRKLEAKEGDQDVYLGELTAEAARGYVEGAEIGTVRFWITPAGTLAMVELLVRPKAKGKERGNDSGMSMWITLSEVGTAKGDVPEAALKAFEEK